MRNLLITISMLFFSVTLTGCQSAYYGTMEKLGYHKRDILVDRVEEGRDAQEDAKEQFKTALEKFSEVVAYKGGDLQAKYNQLKSELDRSESRATKVRNKIDDIQNVAEALFEEWAEELQQYTNERLRKSSEEQLYQTKQSYAKLIQAMKRAETKMETVLAAFRDQVLFLKHNLNARAIASLQGELDVMEADIAALIKDMEASIAEANAFISNISE
ncbi:MAG: DUF2959 domain-containing protein [Sedimentisphaerales bacterium]|nr:DUF2959 domain-containing protein [Sedimentisphaerales bacterium]